MLLLENNLTKNDFSFEPQFFRIYHKEDQEQLESILKAKPHIQIHNKIVSQLDELIKSRYPKKKPQDSELEFLRTEHIGKFSLLEYGVWVYYPWSAKLVHLLDEEEFVEMRTNRNMYKITREERDLLSSKRVGVVGLSVGQSVSITMAMERGFGEIRLADFDLLELTNLNRIRTGVHNLGVPKVVIVAREIKEIDPFLKVTSFPDGLTEENMDRFFLEGGKLDVIIDECDGLDIKILLRHKAKALQVPVVMDASDKGTLDVERFDLEPERPILHGLIDHLDHTKIKELKTNEEKIPYLLPMVGLETASARLKASMVEVGQSITTWPQLASAVTLGGALGADVSRRIMLGQYTDSGRYWVDLEALIANKEEQVNTDYTYTTHTAPDLTVEIMKTAVAALPSLPPQEVVLSAEQVTELVTAAASAPSGGNNQPWKWLFEDGRLYLFHDAKQSVSWIDFKHTASYIALGASIENLKIRAGHIGLETEYIPFPNPADLKLIAAFSFAKASSDAYCPELNSGIGMRLTNRKKGSQEPLKPEVAQELKNIVNIDHVATLEIVEDQDSIAKIAHIVSSVERIRFLFPQGHHELFGQELRFPDANGTPILEGLDIATLEISESDRTGLMVASNPEVISLLNKWGGGAAFEKISRGSVLSSSAIGMVTMPTYSNENFLKGGEALQRAWIQANLKGLSFQPLSGGLFIFDRLNQTGGEGMPEKMIDELTSLQNELREVFSVLNTRTPLFLFRLSYADAASTRSLKRPLEDMLKFS
ncbi:MAG: Rv1355c family protein [Pedobacter sp.]|nr:MAG: Rv1355c family protein [Pedobacter sp.]